MLVVVAVAAAAAGLAAAFAGHESLHLVTSKVDGVGRRSASVAVVVVAAVGGAQWVFLHLV